MSTRWCKAFGCFASVPVNPACQHAVTIADILKEDGLHIILEQFTCMIQSGKNVFIDDNTRLFVYTFSPPSGGAKRFFCADKEEFLRKSKSVVVINNPGTKICFSKVFVLGLAHVADNQVVYKKYLHNNLHGGNALRWKC